MIVDERIYWNGYSDIEDGIVLAVTPKSAAISFTNGTIIVKDKEQLYDSKVRALMNRADLKTKEAADAMKESSRCTKLALELSEVIKESSA